LEHERHVEQATFVECRGVELEAADDMDRLRTATEVPQPGGILFILGADTGEGGEHRAKQETEPLVTPVGAVGEASVDQKNRPPQFAGAPEEVGPDLRFDEDDGLGIDGSQGTGDAGTSIDREIDPADVGGQFAFELAHAGRGRGGNDDLEIGHARFDRPDELGAKVDFADAYRMRPQHVAIGQRLLQLRIIFAKALAEAFAPIAAPAHP
jgi:hypothetical protein